MNGTWYQITSMGLTLFYPSLAQEPSPVITPFEVTNIRLGEIALVDVIVGLVILLLGYFVALFAKSLIKSLLSKTDVDNRIATWVSGREGEQSLPIEEWTGTVVFWLIFLFAVVAFLEKLQLSAASTPLTALLNEITSFLPRVLAAIGLIALAWVVATICRSLLIRVLRVFRVDERLAQQVRDEEAANQVNQFSISDTLGNALYWFIFLLFLPLILGTLNLQGLLEPVQNMVYDIISILPNLIAAIIIAAAGWLVAQVVSRIVANLLAAMGADQFGHRFGLGRTPGSQSLSSITGTIVYVLILIPVAIAALNKLGIDAISQPAVLMLTQIFEALPQIFMAGVILTVAYFVGRFVSDLLTNVLTSIGFNNVFQWLGITSTTPPVPPQEASDPGLGYQTPQTTVVQPSTPQKTPSEIVGIIALVGIMLFATVTATDLLGLYALTAIINQIIVISGRVLIGLVIFAVGLYLANLAFSLIASTHNRQARLLGQIARISIIALVSAMALQQMGIASDIVNLAFGLLLGAIAVAIAIAFGLGGRDVAAEQIRDFLSRFKRE